MVTVQVVRSSTGKPEKGVRVSISFDGLFRGMSDNVYTGSNGEAHFNNDPGTGTVYVNGSSRFKGKISGRIIVYI